MKKKANFQMITASLIGFMGFALVVIAVIVMMSTIKTTNIVCTADGASNMTQTYYNGTCWACRDNLTTPTYLNTSDMWCYNSSNRSQIFNASNMLVESPTAEWNATRQLSDASMLPPQFASLIVIIAGLG